jgi:predicted ATPase
VIRTHSSPFVGRDMEQTLLHGLFDRSAREQAMQLVTLVGEPGVGKSRLCAELFRYVDDRPELISWRQGRCLPYGEGITFWALGEIVKAHAGIYESDPPEVAEAKLDEVLPEVEERPWLKARLLPLLGIDSGQPASREESFTAWRRFLEAVAADGPAVVVVEDLHWADPALLEFLAHLAEWVDGVPLLLLCTARPELYEKHPTWVGGTRNAQTINLAPLSDAETTELVQALLSETVSERVERVIVERAGGNPLYAEEFVRLIADRGLDESSEGVAFPQSVQALIAARLDTLSPDRKSMLQDAAVVGKVFWAGALTEMGQWDRTKVDNVLQELSRKELVRPARSSSIEREAEYAFWHALVRDVTYLQILRAERVRRHRAAAGWIEQTAGERVEDVADVLSHHYLPRSSFPRQRARPSKPPSSCCRRAAICAWQGSGRWASTPLRRRRGSRGRSASAPRMTRSGRSCSSAGQTAHSRRAGRAKPWRRSSTRLPGSASAATVSRLQTP